MAKQPARQTASRLRVANRLRLILDQRQLTQADLAELTDLPYAVIRRMARQGSNPPLHLALVVSRVLDVPVQELYWVEPATPKRASSAEEVDT